MQEFIFMGGGGGVHSMNNTASPGWIETARRFTPMHDYYIINIILFFSWGGGGGWIPRCNKRQHS